MEIGEKCTNSEDPDTFDTPERTVIMEAAGISPLNKVVLQALDEKKLSLKDNISQWLTTSDSIICSLDECRKKKFDPESVIHSSLDDRQSSQKPSFPSLVPLKPLLQKTLQHDPHSGAKMSTSSKTKPVRSSCEKECIVDNSGCSNGKTEKVQHTTDHGILRPQGIVCSKNVNVTPMNEQLYVPQCTRSNIRYSAIHQPANVFSRQCVQTCGSIPHQTIRSTANQCVGVFLGQPCLGCSPSKYPLLTSRNLCFHLQYDTNICTYHKQLLSILNGTISHQQSVNCVPEQVDDRSRMVTPDQEKRSVHLSDHQQGSDHGTLTRHQQSKIDTSVVKLAVSSKRTPLSDKTNVSLNISQSLHQLSCAAAEVSFPQFVA